MIHILGETSSSILTAVHPEVDSQPNASDLRLGRVYRINSAEFMISEEGKRHRGSVEVLPDANGWIRLEQGSYEVVMENKITVGADEAGWVITRSTLNRNGMAGALHVNCGPVSIKKGTRVAQFLLFKAEALSKYAGSYGSNSEHDKKYT